MQGGFFPALQVILKRIFSAMNAKQTSSSRMIARAQDMKEREDAGADLAAKFKALRGISQAAFCKRYEFDESVLSRGFNRITPLSRALIRKIESAIRKETERQHRGQHAK